MRDSTVFDDAVATQDTVTQLVAAMRKVARLVPGAKSVIERVAQLDYSKPGKPDIDWDDADAKQNLVSDLVTDALAVLGELCGQDAPHREEAAADAVGLLALVAGQDVEPADGSEGTDGRWRIARRVAPDRVISTVDPQARHTRKSKSTRRDGFRGHVSTEPETGLITDAELTSAAGEEGSDPVVGQQMIARDRFHRPETETPQPDTGGDAAPADEHEADQSGGDEAVAEPPAAAAGDSGEIATAGTDSARRPPRPARRCGPAGVRRLGLRHRSRPRRLSGRRVHTVIKPKPLRPAVPGGFTLDDFTIEPAGAVTCPAGHTRPMSPKRTVTFGRLCVGCPLRQRCSAAADGRSMSIHPHEQLLRAARAQARTPRFKQDYPTRSRGADHCLGRHPTRRITLRYLGVAKNHAWLRNRTAAINLRTLVNAGLTRHDGAGPWPDGQHRSGALDRDPAHAQLVSAGRTTTLSTNKVRPTAAETALSAFFPPVPHSLFRGVLDEVIPHQLRHTFATALVNSAARCRR